jgi:hypothetical protein
MRTSEAIQNAAADESVDGCIRFCRTWFVLKLPEQSGTAAPHSTTLRVIEGTFEIRESVMECGAAVPLLASPGVT